MPTPVSLSGGAEDDVVVVPLAADSALLPAAEESGTLLLPPAADDAISTASGARAMVSPEIAAGAVRADASFPAIPSGSTLADRRGTVVGEGAARETLPTIAVATMADDEAASAQIGVALPVLDRAAEVI
jgi:hypothetical protein